MPTSLAGKTSLRFQWKCLAEKNSYKPILMDARGGMKGASDAYSLQPSQCQLRSYPTIALINLPRTHVEHFLSRDGKPADERITGEEPSTPGRLTT